MKTILTEMNWYAIPVLFFHKPILIKLHTGHKFYVSNSMDIWTLKEVILDKQYNQLNKLRHGMENVIDIGASIGDFSIMMSDYANHVYAYEMNSERIILMRKNIQINNKKNIIVTQKKVGSLSSIFIEKKIRYCNFLKIDCEGSEYTIFNHADSDTLQKINTIAMEVHFFTKQMREQYIHMKHHLENNGFSLLEVPNQVHDTIGFLFAQRSG